MTRQVCPFHADEDIVGQPAPGDGLQFTCDRKHEVNGGGPHTWLSLPEPPGVSEITGLRAELGLDVELPAAVQSLGVGWFEYGVVERAYALARPKDFRLLVARQGHTAIAAKRFTVSSYLAGALGRLSRQGTVVYKPGPATGRWNYLSGGVSWWAAPGTPEDAPDVTWASLEQPMDHVPGSTEVCPRGQCYSDDPAACSH